MRQIYLIGIGMGNPDTLTVGAQKIIARSDCLIGAKRMLQTVNHPTARQFSSFRNEEIAVYIAQQPKSWTAANSCVSRDWVMRRCGSVNSCPTRRSASFPAPPNSWHSRALTRWRSC